MKKLAQIEYLDIAEDSSYESIIEKVTEACFTEENLLDKGLYLSVILTNPQHIQELNNTYRKINRPTDVLSFPMFEKEEIDSMVESGIWDYNDILGDMVISIEQVEQQAKEYGHSFERELSYMVVHSFYHLMGYDHIKEEDKIIMRPKEEYVLENLGTTR